MPLRITQFASLLLLAGTLLPYTLLASAKTTFAGEAHTKSAQKVDETAIRQVVQKMQNGQNSKNGQMFASAFAKEHDECSRPPGALRWRSRKFFRWKSWRSGYKAKRCKNPLSDFPDCSCPYSKPILSQEPAQQKSEQYHYHRDAETGGQVGDCSISQCSGAKS
jgi:hypothetical protein